MSCNTLSSKDPAEKVVVTFDFTLALNPGETLTTVVSVTSSVVLGSDPAPTALLSGAASVSAGALIQQQVQGGIDATNYYIKALANTSAGRTLALAAILPVRSM